MPRRQDRAPVVFDPNTLVTNDRDLLDLPNERQWLFRFRIVTPGAALAELSRRK